VSLSRASVCPFVVGLRLTTLTRQAGRRIVLQAAGCGAVDAVLQSGKATESHGIGAC
jgi:hypothetical protein